MNDMRLKVSIISIFFPPEIGAASHRIYSMASLLKAGGVDVEILTALPNYPRGKIFHNYRRKFMVKETVKGITARRYWLFASNSSKSLKRILSMLSFSATIFASLPHLLARRPQLIIINSPPLLLGLAGVILAKICGARSILNISDIWPLSAYELGVIGKGFMYRRLEDIEKYMYKMADGFLVQSQEIMDHIDRIQPAPPKMLYRNLQDLSKFIDIIPRFERTRIIYTGLLGVAQGIFDICRNINFEALGVELHIYGDGNERSEIEKYIKNHSDCNIFLHDVVALSELPEILSQFHAMLVSLRGKIYGAMPSKLYTAIASGLPVIFAGMGGSRDFMEKYRLGWASDSQDYATIYRNIQALVKTSESQYISLRKHIAQLAKMQFNIEVQASELIHFVDQIYKQ